MTIYVNYDWVKIVLKTVGYNCILSKRHILYHKKSIFYSIIGYSKVNAYKRIALLLYLYIYTQLLLHVNMDLISNKANR